MKIVISCPWPSYCMADVLSKFIDFLNIMGQVKYNVPNWWWAKHAAASQPKDRKRLRPEVSSRGKSLFFTHPPARLNHHPSTHVLT